MITQQTAREQVRTVIEKANKTLGPIMKGANLSYDIRYSYLEDAWSIEVWQESALFGKTRTDLGDAVNAVIREVKHSFSERGN